MRSVLMQAHPVNVVLERYWVGNPIEVSVGQKEMCGRCEEPVSLARRANRAETFASNGGQDVAVQEGPWQLAGIDVLRIEKRGRTRPRCLAYRREQFGPLHPYVIELRQHPPDGPYLLRICCRLLSRPDTSSDRREPESRRDAACRRPRHR